MRDLGRVVGALVAGLALLVGCGSAASAATLKASYLLQGTRASQTAGAPDLVDLGPGNRFTTETIDGAPRQVLAFPRGGGLSLATDGLVDPVSHSIVMNVRLDDVFGFRRLLDFSGGDADDGLYDLDGRLVLYGAGSFGGDADPAFDGSWVQVALTSEATLTGPQWTVTALNGSPVQGAATPRRFRLGADGLRFFKDNVRGPSRREESAGAVACILLYDGALTTAELRQVAVDPLCPAPRPVAPEQLGFTPGTYVGRTSQGLPIGLEVGRTSIQYVEFGWRARCADGRVHRNSIGLGGAPIRNRRFSVFGVLTTGGRGRVRGRLDGERAHGRLSRWAGSAFDTTCVARGIRWHAHLTR
ncbi:MAG TPA: hypothetical protein VF250_12580 [Conexibacter sp.]